MLPLGRAASMLLLGATVAAADAVARRPLRELQPGAATPPPIDLVVAWVREPSQNEWPRVAARCPDAEPSRTRDSGELLTNILLARRNLPWLRTIWVLTNDESPCFSSNGTWANFNKDKSAPRIRSVSHEKIWPPGALNGLPTYNSMAIEANMHRIDGLAEHFIYANDDMFFLAPLEPEDFYDEQDGYATPYVLINPRRNTSTNLDLRSGGQEFVVTHNQAVAASLAGRVVDAEALFAAAKALYPHPWYRQPGQLLLNHMPYILRKSFVVEAQARWPEVYSAHSSMPCRSGAWSKKMQEITGESNYSTTYSPVFSYNWFNVLHKNAKPSPRIYAQADSLAIGVARNYGFLEAHADGYNVPCAEAAGDAHRIAEWLDNMSETKPMVLCLEDDFAQDCPVGDRTSAYAKEVSNYRKFFLKVTPGRHNHLSASQCRLCADGLKEC